MLIRRKDGTILVDSEASLDLSGQDLTDANFQGIVLDFCDFSDADLRRADFSDSVLYGTFLYRANCSESNFSGALLQGVVLSEANLRGADLRKARIINNNMGTPSSLIGGSPRRESDRLNVNRF